MAVAHRVQTEDPSKVVWLLDPSNKPELEVELEIEYQPDELPGLHYARANSELEVDLELVDDREDELEDLTAACELEDDTVVTIGTIYAIRDFAPRGYAEAYRAW